MSAPWGGGGIGRRGGMMIAVQWKRAGEREGPGLKPLVFAPLFAGDPKLKALGYQPCAPSEVQRRREGRSKTGCHGS